MTHPPSFPRQIVLTQREGRDEIAVDTEAFFEFSFEVAESLQELVAKWQPMASPESSKKTEFANRSSHIV